MKRTSGFSRGGAGRNVNLRSKFRTEHVIAPVLFVSVVLTSLAMWSAVFLGNGHTQDHNEQTVQDKRSAPKILYETNVDAQKYINKWNPPTASTDGLSACLLVKDDNDNLVEWIAYHYTTMPLRHLIITADPSSKTSPQAVIDRWSAPHLGIDIRLWTDDDFLPEKVELNRLLDRVRMPINRNITFAEEDKRGFQMHIVRQEKFISECMTRFKREGRDWVLLVDSDEYLILNSADKKGNEKIFEKVKREVKSPLTRPWRVDRLNRLRKSLPKVADQTVRDVINQQYDGPPWSDEPCMAIPRLFFGSLESDPKDISKNVPAEIDPKSLDTLRYRKHASKGEFEFNFYDKAIVDVSRVSYFHVMNCHRILSLCNNVRPFEEAAHVARNDGQRNITPLSMTLLRVHHFMGSWEKYGAREDTRRTKGNYEKLGNVDLGEDDDIRPWIGKFKEMFGDSTKSMLAKGNWPLIKN